LTLSGWNYRKSHVITSGTTLTNYQTKIRVYYGSGTDSTNTTYLNSKCNTDFSDIRFTTFDGDTLISYWVESVITGNYADIWIKAPSITTTTIYIYYGNTSAVSTSSGDNTFELFDDFDGSTLDNAKWTSNNLTATLSNSIATIYGDGLSSWGWLQSILTYNQGYSLISKLKFQGRNSINNDGGLVGFRTSQGGEVIQIMYYNDAPSSDFRAISTALGGSVSNDSNADESYHIYEVLRTTAPTCVCYIDDSLAQNGTITTVSACSTTSLSINFEVKGGSGYGIEIDWVAVRKCSNVEPTHSTWGSEELLGVKILSNFSYSISNNFVAFTDTSVSTTPIVSRFWDFGDGLVDDSATVTHEYFAPATYNATLSISNLEGFSDSITKSIVIPNQSIFWPQSVSILDEQFPTFEPCEVKFQSVSTPSKYIETTSYLWDFGDSTTSTLQDPFHVYESSGVKTVTLTVSNIYGSKSTTTTIDVSANVKVYFSPNYRIGNNPLSVEFHDISVPQSEILTRIWNFGDGSTSTTTTPTHQYTDVGTYSPSLTVTYHGGTKTLTKYNSMIVGIQTRTLSDEISFSEAQEPLTIATFIDKIDFTEIFVPALIVLTDKLSYIQREIPLTRGILETGKTFAFHLTEIGRKVFNVFDSYGRKIIKSPTYENATGCYTCETIVSFEDTLQFEEELTEQFPT
jgi:PKD repeat protein